MRSRLIPPGVTYMDRAGVRIKPPALEFGGQRMTKGREQITQRIAMTVSNVDKSSKNIRLYAPQNQVSRCIFEYVEFTELFHSNYLLLTFSSVNFHL